MPPPRKKTKVVQPEANPSPLLTDVQTSWLVKGDDQTVDIHAKGEVFQAHRRVLMKCSGYFEKCLSKDWIESSGEICFDDIDPTYLAYFIGLAYNLSSIMPLAPPPRSEHPEVTAAKTPMRNFVEVYKLCDRFICPRMCELMRQCIDTSIADGHRAMFRAPPEDGVHRAVAADFADAYEALDCNLPAQREMGAVMMEYFCGAVRLDFWAEWADENGCRWSRFLVAVSVHWAKTLWELETARKHRRKELKGP